MKSKSILEKLNVISQCKQYRLPLWQCPQFFFLIMGIVTIVMILAGYGIFTKMIVDPLMVARIVVGLGLSLLIINFALTRGFRKAAEANQMKSEFIRIVSHQMRAPLSNCEWAVEFLMSGKLGKIEEKQVKYLGILKENIYRMQELISKLLTASRIEAGTLPFEKVFFSLADLIKDSILKFEPSAEASGIEILFKPQPNLPKALGDPSQIKVVVENLLDNAIHYTPPLSGSKKEKEKIKIRLRPKKNYLYFEIEDRGIGISKLNQKYIFQKFFRGKEALKHQTQGSGLGLYISKSIIEKSGGQISFDSKPGKGSIFWFTLPIK